MVLHMVLPNFLDCVFYGEFHGKINVEGDRPCEQENAGKASYN